MGFCAYVLTRKRAVGIVLNVTRRGVGGGGTKKEQPSFLLRTVSMFFFHIPSGTMINRMVQEGIYEFGKRGCRSSNGRPCRSNKKQNKTADHGRQNLFKESSLEMSCMVFLHGSGYA
jgi:hypothetical protein